jgi:putative Mg2+ transporter-C (MgtC) family protein
VIFEADLELLAKIGTAFLCGGIIGFEREFSHKPAGLRTNLLICTGSTLFTIASLTIAGERGDPGRIAAQIVTGVGFLGAGTIIQSRGNVLGLTSAATIWVVAAIGVWIGLGRYVAAFSSTIVVIVVLWILRRPEEYIGRRLTLGRVALEMEDSGKLLERVAAVFQRHRLSMDDIRTSDGDDAGRVRLSIALPVHKKGRNELIAELREIDGVRSVKETVR